MHPYESELQAISAKLQACQMHLASIHADMHFIDHFDLEGQKAASEALHERAADLHAEAYEEPKNSAWDGFAMSLPVVNSGGLLSRIFGPSKAEIARQQAKMEHKLREAKKATEEAAAARKKHLLAEFEICDLERVMLNEQIRKYERLAPCRASLDGFLAMYQAQERQLREAEQAVLTKQRQALEKVAPIAAGKCEHVERIDKARWDIQRARELKAELMTCIQRGDRVGQRAVEEQCLRELGRDIDPGVVEERCQKEILRAQNAIEKIDQRIAHELGKHQSQISLQRVFLDGNNLSNRSGGNGKDRYVGTLAVEALATELLSRGYAVTVVFDHKFAKRMTTTFDRLQQCFEKEVNVYRSPPGTPADFILMQLAIEPTDCIISNDQFTDFPDKLVVKECRVYGCFINDRTAFVEKLDLTATLRHDVNPAVAG